MRLYDGPERPDAEVVILGDTLDVQIVAVDGKLLGRASPKWTAAALVDVSAEYRPPRDIFHMAPGEHRIEVRVYRVDNEGYWIETKKGINLWTIRHDFAPGYVYDFSLESYAHGIQVGEIPVLLETNHDGSERKVVKPLMVPDLPPAPALGCATVVGAATAGANTATGRTVFLLPDNAASRAWAAKEEISTSVRPPKHVLQTTVGYGMGFYTFEDVRPGKYLIAFKVASKGPRSASAIEVKAGETKRVEVDEPADFLAPDPADVHGGSETAAAAQSI